MNCSYCNKLIEPNNHVKVNEYYFCDNLCKYSFQKNSDSEKENDQVNSNNSLPDYLKFHIDFPNFNLNQIIVQGSFYGRPKLYINNKRVKSLKRNIFSRKQSFHIEDDNGSIITATLYSNVLDAIPSLEINNIKIVIRNRLKWYEYTWISIPGILLFTGGGIGGVLGFVGIYTNSILFRKFSSTIVKYLLTGVNTFITFVIFLKVVFFILPIFEEVSFHYLQLTETKVSLTSEENKNRFNILTNSPWLYTEMYDLNGNNITDPNSIMRDSKRYFYKNGKYSQIFFDGSVLNGKWKMEIW